MKRIFLMIFILVFSIPVFSQSLAQVKKLIYYERYNSASDILHKLLRNDPGNQEAWYLLSLTYLEQNRVEAIKDTLQKAPQGILDNGLLRAVYGHILLRENDMATANEYFGMALKETKEKDPAVLKEVARAYIDTRAADANRAVELLKKAIKRDKKNPELYVLLGNAYRKLNNGSDAYSSYNKALEIDPHYARASYRLGKIFTSQKDTIYLRYFTRALKADSLYAPALYEMYYHYYFTDVAKALKYLNKYIAASDYDRENDYRLTDMLYLNKQYDAAIRKGLELVEEEKDSVSPRIYKLVATCYKRSGDFENARDYMEKYFTRNTDTTYLLADYRAMGEIYDSLGHYTDSAAHYYELTAKLTKKDADRRTLYKKIALMYEQDKNYGEQALWLQKYYADNPGATNLDLFNCGIAYYYAEEYGLADSVFSVYTEKYPDQKYGYYWRAKSNAAIDTAMEQGLAIPHYLKAIEIAEKDTAGDANQKILVESYGYIASFKANHDKDYDSSIEYFEKILRLQPDNEDAKKYIAVLQKYISDGSN